MVVQEINSRRRAAGLGRVKQYLATIGSIECTSACNNDGNNESRRVLIEL